MARDRVDVLHLRDVGSVAPTVGGQHSQANQLLHAEFACF